MKLDTTAPTDDLAQLRGLKPETLTGARITREDTEGKYYGWWKIPYPNRTGIWKHRYRNPNPTGKPKYQDEPGAKFHLYNPLLLGPGEEEIWFCEGEFDTLVLCELGLNALGIHGVDNVATEEREGRFRREWSLLFEDTLCITMFDNDDAGRQAGRRLAAGLNGVVFDEWDARFSDVNDWFVADREGLVDALDRFRSRVRSSRGLE